MSQWLACSRQAVRPEALAEQISRLLSISRFTTTAGNSLPPAGRGRGGHSRFDSPPPKASGAAPGAAAQAPSGQPEASPRRGRGRGQAFASPTGQQETPSQPAPLPDLSHFEDPPEEDTTAARTAGPAQHAAGGSPAPAPQRVGPAAPTTIQGQGRGRGQQFVPPPRAPQPQPQAPGSFPAAVDKAAPQDEASLGPSEDSPAFRRGAGRGQAFDMQPSDSTTPPPGAPSPYRQGAKRPVFGTPSDPTRIRSRAPPRGRQPQGPPEAGPRAPPASFDAPEDELLQEMSQRRDAVSSGRRGQRFRRPPEGEYGEEHDEAAPSPSGGLDTPGGTVGRSQRPRTRGPQRPASSSFTATGPGTRKKRDALLDQQGAYDAEAPFDPTAMPPSRQLALDMQEPFALFDPKSKTKIRSYEGMRKQNATQQHHDMDQMFHIRRYLRPNEHMHLGAPSLHPPMAPQNLLEELKPGLMQAAEITTDEQWQEVLGKALADWPRQQRKVGLCRPEDDEAALEGMLQAGLPRSHPMYGHVENSLHMLQANPSWKFEQKELYLQRLIRKSSQLTA